MKIYDLDDILLSPRTHAAWLEYCPTAVADLIKKYPNLKGAEIADEQFRVLPNGNGQIFVKIRSVEIKMNVPENEWSWKT